MFVCCFFLFVYLFACLFACLFVKLLFWLVYLSLITATFIITKDATKVGRHINNYKLALIDNVTRN